jgi:hypothetical protein
MERDDSFLSVSQKNELPLGDVPLTTPFFTVTSFRHFRGVGTKSNEKVRGVRCEHYNHDSNSN